VHNKLPVRDGRKPLAVYQMYII